MSKEDAANLLPKTGLVFPKNVVAICFLIMGEDYPPYKDGLPQYVRLKMWQCQNWLILKYNETGRRYFPRA